MRSTLWLALVLAGCPEPEAVDAADDDGDGYGADVDCNDGAPSVFPGATELCDGIDQDCDGSLDDEPKLVLFEDGDGDGFGDPGRVVSACGVSQGVVANGADCDDGDEDVSPDATETCDGVDDNCSGDEEDAEDGLPWYYDGDGDGYGTSARVYACEMPDGYAEVSRDCRDTDDDVSPGADELCNGADDDCDGDVDEADAVDAIAWYPDEDEDGFGTAGEPVYACVAPDGYGEGTADCDDRAAGNYPGADELCDGIDQDCDGAVDEAPIDGSIWYTDNDMDGAGDASRFAVRCEGDLGLVSSSDDCDDADSTAFPGAIEVCDGADDDCDGAVDDGATDAGTFYADVDGDGFGDAAAAVTTCGAPLGHVGDASDCDDTDDTRFPGAAETCDGLDDDCDGIVDGNWDEADLDLFNPLTANGSAVWESSALDGWIRLTSAGPDQAGTAFFGGVTTDLVVAAFAFESSGGTGGQGVAMAFLDESDTTLVGTTDVFGLGGLSGYAVGFDPVADLVVLMETSTGLMLASAIVPELHDTGRHDVLVRFDAGAFEVDLDGAPVLSVIVGSSYTGWAPQVGLSASTTDSATADHIVDDLGIGCP